MNLQLLAQAAQAAFQASGALCQSSLDVPVIPPPGRCYQPSHQQHSDFHTGDATTGWNCLGVGQTMTKVLHCRYSYHASSGYVGPTVGLPDPGPDGFEVAAHGDVDGNGIFSTFTITGTKDPSTGTYTLSPVHEDLPLE